MEFIDSHCHFDFPQFDQDRLAVWHACAQRGVKKLLIPGVSPAQWRRAQTMAEQYSGVYFSAGVHPLWCETYRAELSTDAEPNELIQTLKNYLGDKKCIAVGECGLDKSLPTSLGFQQELFTIHLQLASELRLPLIIHCRAAHNELILLLKQFSLPAGGVIHAFSGSYELAMSYLRLGFRLGIGGVITYERANKTREAVKKLPLESLLLETDAPDMPLAGHQGERNSPENIPIIAQQLAQLRDQTLDTIARETTKNFQRLFLHQG